MALQKVIAVEFLVLVFLCMEFDNSHLVLGEARCNEREREALVMFKKGLIDEGGILSSWGSEDSCCKWKGVVCSNTTSNSHVIALLLGFDFLESPLRGNITDALLELHYLTTLDLSMIQFDDQIPEFIGSMKQLKHLFLLGCYFHGTVPPQLGNLTNLRTLDLSYNSLRSENLDWLSHLSLLTRLDLSYSFDFSHTSWLKQIIELRSLQELYLCQSNISAVIPPAPSFNSSLASLSILDLSYNKLTSSSLDWLSNISTSLAEVRMPYNALDGPIPDVFGRLVFLKDLRLYGNMLEGRISTSLANLSHLQTLDLSMNNIRLNFEELFGNQSTKVKMSLQSLDLSHNQLKGSLSVSELKAFPALKKLVLGSNEFIGSIPELHSALEEIDVSFNKFEGTITEAYFTKLHNLKKLDFSFNSLTLQIAKDWIPPFQLRFISLAGCNMSPRFPRWIQTQRNVRFLDLSFARISDEVPKWLWSWSPSLTYLNISHNNISGIIPHLPFTTRFQLDVTSNKFSGPLPLLQQNISLLLLSKNMFSGSISSICSLRLVHIWFIDLSNNHFSGEIPNCWDKMSVLWFLNLGNNMFSGEIPHTLGALKMLISLQLSGNNLSGGLPSTLQKCRRLMFIDLGGNKLTGNVPAWIGENKNLMYLILSRNNFNGSIPREIFSLTYIRVLDLSINNISGEIPHFSNKLVSLSEKNPASPRLSLENCTIFDDILKQFEYAFVHWKGGEFEYKKNLRHLKLIDLSSYRLVGSIPESFSSMRELVSLNLSRNHLIGTIVSDIGEMKMLEVLDLSRNQLSGKIPISLAQLHFLAVMDLGNNSLSGKIPSSTQLQSFDAIVYGGNNELCGLPLKMCPEEVLNPSITDQEESFKKDGGYSFIEGFLVSMAFGFIVGFWGVVASLVLKRSWRYAYFNFWDEVESWLFITTAKLFKTSTPI